MKTTNNKPMGNGRKPTELVMQAGLELLPLIMNNIPQAVFWKDRNLVYLGCNQAFADDAGFPSPEDVIGKTDFDMPWKSQAELYRADDSLVMEKGEPKFNYEEPQTTPSGSTIWLSTSKIPVRENGQVVAVLGMYEDVTARKQVEEALLLRDRALASSLSAVIILNISDNRPIYVNDALLKMTGYTREEVMQIGLADITGNPEASREIRAAVQSQGFFIGEELIKRKDGSTFPASFFTSLIKDAKGQPLAVQSNFFDISERKQAEEAVRQSQTRFQTLVETLGEWVWEVDSKGIYTYVSPNIKNLLGYEPEEVMGKSPFDLMPPEESQRVAGVFGPLLSTQQPLVGLENTNRHKDGRLVVLETNGVPFFDANGQLLGYRGTDRDITERKKAEESRRTSEQRYQTIFNASPVMFWLKDTKNNMLQINEAAAAFENVKPEDLNGRSSYDVYPHEQAEAFYQDDLQVIRSGKPKLGIVEKHTSPGTGETTWLETGKVPVRDEKDEVTGVLAFAVDITERQQTEKALQESEERFRRFTEATAEGLVFHENGKIIDANPAALAMYGLAENGEFIGRNLLEFIVPEHHQLVLKQMQLETVLPYEAQCFRADGSTFPVETSTRIYKSGDRIIRVSSIRDITERKKAEMAVRQSEANLSSALRVAKMGHWEFDIATQMFTFNDQYYSLHGTTAQEVGGYQISVQRFAQEFVHPEDGPVVGMSTQQAVETTDPNFQVQIEARIMHKDGQPRWVTVWFRVEKDGQGRTIKLHGVNQDVTERKQLEAQVRQAFERRGYQVQVSTEVSQEIAAASETDELFDRVVKLTRERFGYYHTQLLRYDPAQDAVLLINGYGETGRKMLADGHKMSLGEGLIGTAVATGETVMRPTLADDPDWHPNPLLPETKGEIAVPIKWQDNVLGVLDVQSDQAGALTEDDRLLLEGLCGQIAVAMEQTRLRQEMAERLEEVNRLYQSMSREGWRTYRETADLPAGFMFDQTNVKPVDDAVLTTEAFATVPMKVLGGETVGNLAVANDPRRPLLQEDIDFLQQVSEQVALALEGARLAAQTQSALAQSEKLFEASRILTQSTDLQELTAKAVDMLGIPAINRALLTTFNYDAQDNIDSLDIVANWWNGTGHEVTGVGTHYPYDVIRAMSFFVSPAPVFFSDTHTDERVDAVTMNLVERLNLRAVAVLPLYTGTHQTGALILEAEEPHTFTEEEIRLFTALAPQISTMLENRRQFERAQRQAEREGLLNVISQKIQSATTVEAVLQIAARELGHALGAPMTIAQLSMKDKK